MNPRIYLWSVNSFLSHLSRPSGPWSRPSPRIVHCAKLTVVSSNQRLSVFDTKTVSFPSTYFFLPHAEGSHFCQPMQSAIASSITTTTGRKYALNGVVKHSHN